MTRRWREPLRSGYSSRLRSTLSKQSFLPLIPQVVQTLKSLSSVALLAVSQLCTMRSKLSGRSFSPLTWTHLRTKNRQQAKNDYLTGKAPYRLESGSLQQRESGSLQQRDAMGRAARMAISSLTSIDGVPRCLSRTI